MKENYGTGHSEAILGQIVCSYCAGLVQRGKYLELKWFNGIRKNEFYNFVYCKNCVSKGINPSMRGVRRLGGTAKWRTL